MRLRENHNYIPTTKNYTTACEFKTPFLLWGTQQRYSNALLCCVASHLVADENLWLCHFPDTLHGLCYSEKKKPHIRGFLFRACAFGSQISEWEHMLIIT